MVQFEDVVGHSAASGWNGRGCAEFMGLGFNVGLLGLQNGWVRGVLVALCVELGSLWEVAGRLSHT